MSYYALNKCPEDSLTDIGKLCEQEDLHEGEPTPPIRAWNSLDHPIFSVVRFNPGKRDLPLLVETYGTIDPENPRVINFIKKLISTTGADKVYDHYDLAIAKPYDMAMFK